MHIPERARTDSTLQAGQRQWASCRDALRRVADTYLLHDIVEHASKEIQQRDANTKAADAITRRLTEGTLSARPVWFRFVQGDRETAVEHVFHLQEPDRVISPNFWRTLQRLQSNAAIDWIAGDFSFEDSDTGIYATGHAYGVKFDLPGLPALDLTLAKPRANPGGAPRKWDWDGALLHLAALAHGSADGLFRDDGRDPNQSDIAWHLRAWFIDTCDDSPESSQLRDYGRRFVAELNAAKLRAANNLQRSE